MSHRIIFLAKRLEVGSTGAILGMPSDPNQVRLYTPVIDRQLRTCDQSFGSDEALQQITLVVSRKYRIRDVTSLIGAMW